MHGLFPFLEMLQEAEIQRVGSREASCEQLMHAMAASLLAEPPDLLKHVLRAMDRRHHSKTRSYASEVKERTTGAGVSGTSQGSTYFLISRDLTRLARGRVPK